MEAEKRRKEKRKMNKMKVFNEVKVHAKMLGLIAVAILVGAPALPPAEVPEIPAGALPYIAGGIVGLTLVIRHFFKK